MWNYLNLLLDFEVNPSADDNYATRRRASEHGHLAVVDRLLRERGVDPSADDNIAIQYASQYGHVAIVERLLLGPRVHDASVI